MDTHPSCAHKYITQLKSLSLFQPSHPPFPYSHPPSTYPMYTAICLTNSTLHIVIPNIYHLQPYPTHPTPLSTSHHPRYFLLLLSTNLPPYYPKSLNLMQSYPSPQCHLIPQYSSQYILPYSTHLIFHSRSIPIPLPALPFTSPSLPTDSEKVPAFTNIWIMSGKGRNLS